MFSRPDHAGASNLDCLGILHEILGPESYLEISRQAGGALDVACCPSVVVRPSPSDELIASGQRPALFLFNSDSRAFFDRYDPRMLLGRAVDLAFLDGLPLFEAMLRDFCDVERACAAGSVIVLNNCLPPDSAMAGRDPDDHDRRARSIHPDWWTGDTWKLLPVLAAYRPELIVHAFDADPAGLIAIVGLNPASHVLANQFDFIVAQYQDLADEERALEACRDSVTIRSTQTIAEIFGAWKQTAAAQPTDAIGIGTTTYRFIDPSWLPSIDLPTLMSGGTIGRFPERPDSIRSYYRSAPAFIDDPGRRGIIPPFGDDTIRYRASSIVSVHDAMLVGHRSVLTAAGYLVHDETHADRNDMGMLAEKLSLTDDDFMNEETGLAPFGDGGQFLFDHRGREIVNIDEPVVILSSAEPGNYGSWIYRVMPKLHSIRLPGLEGMRMLVHAPEPYHREYLEALGIQWNAVIHHDVNRLYRLRQAFIPTTRNTVPYLDPGGLRIFEELRRRYGAHRADQRIYVSRLRWSLAGKSTRIMTNEAELITRLSADGFDIIEPETMTLMEQIRVFSSAKTVVGPAGSALYNVVFCQPGTKVLDIESEPDWVPLHSCLFASLGHPYGMFVGETDAAETRAVHKRWSVDIDKLMYRLRLFEGERE